jgi:hypothetical protein
MSMNPDGMHLIISQQIKEWHTIVDEERHASVVPPEAAGIGGGFLDLRRRVQAAFARVREVGRPWQSARGRRRRHVGASLADRSN